MAFEYVPLQTAQTSSELCMVVVRDVPSPWGESAKGLLYLNGLDWQAVSHAPYDTELMNWTGSDNAPVLVTQTGARKSGWAEILLFAEDASAAPPLVPSSAKDRAEMFGLAHELMGERGLCWCRRLQYVHWGLCQGGRKRQVAEYVGGKYGYHSKHLASDTARVIDLLGVFATCLESRGGPYYFGAEITALDVYSAAAMALFAPLAEDVCAMRQDVREGFEALGDDIEQALAPNLLRHRDMMYERHLQLPLQL